MGWGAGKALPKAPAAVLAGGSDGRATLATTVAIAGPWPGARASDGTTGNPGISQFRHVDAAKAGVAWDFTWRRPIRNDATLSIYFNPAR